MRLRWGPVLKFTALTIRRQSQPNEKFLWSAWIYDHVLSNFGIWVMRFGDYCTHIVVIVPVGLVITGENMRSGLWELIRQVWVTRSICVENNSPEGNWKLSYQKRRIQWFLVPVTEFASSWDSLKLAEAVTKRDFSFRIRISTAIKISKMITA